MTTCAAPGCDNPVPRNRLGRPHIYCSPECRPSRRRAGIVVEVDHPDTSPDGRSPERVWNVKLRRGSRVVVVAHDLGWPSADDLARRLDQLLQPERKKEGPVT